MELTKKRAFGAAFAMIVATAIASCSGDDGAAERDAPDAAVDGGGDTGDGDGDGDGDTVDLLRVPATVTGFSSLGEPRSGDGVTVSGEGFEVGERRCTANGLFCVAGGFEP
jgi:hypothetical protein